MGLQRVRFALKCRAHRAPRRIERRMACEAAVIGFQKLAHSFNKDAFQRAAIAAALFRLLVERLEIAAWPEMVVKTFSLRAGRANDGALFENQGPGCH